ncbi:MAG TPA: aldo/keto reductase [Candidatus Paceibacterota bacterium]|nr:aldo/keto reductase [Candidatus Paceibacterota bacterium]
MQTVRLSSGVDIPILGLGTSQMKTPVETVEVIKTALSLGYRLIDTAKMYGNEEPVGEGVRESGIPREEIIVTTKLWPDDFPKAADTFRESLARLGLEYIDIYLIHWPQGFSAEVWQALEALYDQGLVKTLGVSNFSIEQLQDLLSYARVKPALNQVHWNPFTYDLDLLSFCSEHGITLEGYRPLTRGEVSHNETIEEIAAAHTKTYAQVLIRWALERGVVTIPKTTHPDRMRENMDVFDFSLTSDEMSELDDLRRS